MSESKYIPPHSKFTSELVMSDPADAEEMNKRVFGRDYKRDTDGNPIDQSNTSDFSVRNGMAKRDRIQQDLRMCEKYQGKEAAWAKAKHINGLNPKHYAAEVGPYLKAAAASAPSKVPRHADI